MSSTFLPIKRVGGSGRSHLKLEGTILIYNEKHWCLESTLLIPVESVCISERSRFYRDLLIWAVLVPLITVLLAAAVYVFDLKEEGGTEGALGILFATVVLVILVLELGLLFALVMNFLFIKKSVFLSVPSCGIEIEFWKKRKTSHQIDDFLGQIKEKQAQVLNSLVSPSEDVLEIRDLNNTRRLIPLTFLFCLPSIVLRISPLLVLGLVPIGWYFYKAMQLRRHPKEFREAVASYRRRDWEKAISHLKNLQQRLPEYIPAMLLLVETYVRAERFNEALEVAARFPEEYLDDSNSIQLEIWKWKRIHLRRRESQLKTDNQEFS